MRISEPLKRTLLQACKSSFGDVEVILFGSRVDDRKRGGDFDLAIKGEFTKETFRAKKRGFLKYLLKRDLDLPIDLVQYNVANALLKEEIDKGVSLS